MYLQHLKTSHKLDTYTNNPFEAYDEISTIDSFSCPNYCIQLLVVGSSKIIKISNIKNYLFIFLFTYGGGKKIHQNTPVDVSTEVTYLVIPNSNF